MFNPEKQLYKNKFAKESPLNPVEDAVYGWYIKNPQFVDERAEMKSFKDMDRFKNVSGYDANEIEKHKQLIRKLRERDGDKTQRGEILEAVVGKYADANLWFGDMEISKTTEYDDRINHVDFVLEGQGDNGEELHIAVDCTTSETSSRLQEKVDRVVEGIEEDKLGSVEYFQSTQDEDDMRKLINIPRVIVAVPQEEIGGLCQDTLAIVRGETGANENFSQSYLQLFILFQVRDQLQKQKELTDILVENKVGNKEENKETINKIIVHALEKIERILEEKKSSLPENIWQEAESEYQKRIRSLF